MPIQMVSAHAKAYQGLSTDTKPASPAEGSTFRAVDTAEEWTYYNGMWVMRPETEMLGYRLVATAI